MTINLRLLACTLVAGHADAMSMSVGPLERGPDSEQPMGAPKPKKGTTSAFTAFSGREQSDDHAAAILRLRQSSCQRRQVRVEGSPALQVAQLASALSSCSLLLTQHARLIPVLSRSLTWLAATSCGLLSTYQAHVCVGCAACSPKQLWVKQACLACMGVS